MVAKVTPVTAVTLLMIVLLVVPKYRGQKEGVQLQSH